MILEMIAKKLNLSPQELLSYSTLAPRKYKHYSIPKRNGEHRRIAQPAKDLKLIQRLIIADVLSNEDLFPIHRCATAYRKGTSILQNAKPHATSKYLLKLDFIDFFGSIKQNDFLHFLSKKREFGFTNEDAAFLSAIFFLKDGRDYKLSIGAPSSPILSNILMHEFDCKVSNLCNSNGITYTRYSDDMAFSCSVKTTLPEFLPNFRDLVSETNYPNLILNEDKTILTSKKFNRHITGLTLNNEGQISIGRKRKRLLKTKIFLYSKGELPPEEIAWLQGMLHYIKSVEPNFITTLEKKFPNTVTDIISHSTSSID